MKKLFLITARGGSKRLPGKNSKLLNGKPLIRYTIEAALEAKELDDEIYLSTDDQSIADLAMDVGIINRPEELSTDQASSESVIIHAIDFLYSLGKEFDLIVLLQPTSPLRTGSQIREAITLYSPRIDMVISVKETKVNFDNLLLQENKEGFLFKTISYNDNQSMQVYEINGAIYLINPESIKNKGISGCDKKVKYVMSSLTSIDIDYAIDFMFCEFLITEGVVNDLLNS